MSTQSLLLQSVTVGQKSVSPMITSLESQIELVRQGDPELWTEEESNLMMVAELLKEPGMPLLDLGIAIKAGGLNTEGFPRLGVANYYASMERRLARVTMFADGGALFTSAISKWESSEFAIQEDTFPRISGIRSWGYPKSAQTAVPLVPPALRQRDPEGVILLFEVIQWQQVLVPVDPYLLWRVAGDICLILGTWDLTDLELKAQQISRKLGILKES